MPAQKGRQRQPADGLSLASSSEHKMVREHPPSAHPHLVWCSRPRAMYDLCDVGVATQAEVISRLDEQLRNEVLTTQASVMQWVTETKHVADMVALKGQRTLSTDKGVRPAVDIALEMSVALHTVRIVLTCVRVRMHCRRKY